MTQPTRVLSAAAASFTSVKSGGILHSTGTLALLNSTISGNRTGDGANGGSAAGLYNDGSAMLTNTTISGNSTGGVDGRGGGIFNAGSSLTLTNCTVTGNSAYDGHGMYAFGDYPPANLKNTILANNGAASGGDARAAFTSQGHNLVSKSDGSTGFTNGVNGDQVGTVASPLDARLGPLANNGGPTQTHALIAGSTALDAGNNAFVTDPPFTGPTFTDQRGTGFQRIRDAADADTTQTVDIGAFEADPSVEDISDKSTNEDVALLFTFTVGDAATPFSSIGATSNNQTLVPDGNIVVGSGTTLSSRTLSIKPRQTSQAPLPLR